MQSILSLSNSLPVAMCVQNFAEWKLPVNPHPYVIFNTTKWEKTPRRLYHNISGTVEQVKLEIFSLE